MAELDWEEEIKALRILDIITRYEVNAPLSDIEIDTLKEIIQLSEISPKDSFDDACDIAKDMYCFKIKEAREKALDFLVSYLRTAKRYREVY